MLFRNLNNNNLPQTKIIICKKNCLLSVGEQMKITIEDDGKIFAEHENFGKGYVFEKDINELFYTEKKLRLLKLQKLNATSI